MTKSRKVRAFAEQRTLIPTKAYDSLTNRQLFDCVVVFRFRKGTSNRVYRSERELRRATGKASGTKFEHEVLEPLKKCGFILKMDRRMDTERGETYWRLVLLDPTSRPDGWAKKGKWFLQVPDWWLWEHPKDHVTASGVADHWVRTDGWTPSGSTLRAALSLQRADTNSLGETRDKNSRYLSNNMRKSASTGSTALARATDLGWIGGANLSGGHGVKAHRWTRFLPTDPETAEERRRTGAGRKPSPRDPVRSVTPPVTPEQTEVTSADAEGQVMTAGVGAWARSVDEPWDPPGAIVEGGVVVDWHGWMSMVPRVSGHRRGVAPL